MTTLHALVSRTDDGRQAVALVFTIDADGATAVIGCRAAPVRQYDALHSAVADFVASLASDHGVEVRRFNESGSVCNTRTLCTVVQSEA